MNVHSCCCISIFGVVWFELKFEFDLNSCFQNLIWKGIEKKMESLLLLFGRKACCCRCGLLFPTPACFVSFPQRPAWPCPGAGPLFPAPQAAPRASPLRSLTARAQASDPPPSSHRGRLGLFLAPTTCPVLPRLPMMPCRSSTPPHK